MDERLFTTHNVYRAQHSAVAVILLLTQMGGLHGVLPAMNLVQRLVVKHLWNDSGGKVWGRPLPGVTTPQLYTKNSVLRALKRR